MLIPINTDAPIYYFPFATIGLIVVNVICFVLTGMGSVEAAEVWGPWALEHGNGFHPLQWVSSNFIHMGFMHLIGNMIFLWGFGLVVEGKLGWWKFLAVYLGIGVAQCAIEQTIMLGHVPAAVVAQEEAFDPEVLDERLADLRHAALTALQERGLKPEEVDAEMAKWDENVEKLIAPANSAAPSAAQSPGSCGASAVIFGLLALCLVWAPKNEVTLLLLFGMRAVTFEVTYISYSCWYIGFEVLTATFQQFAVATSTLHLMGAGVGFALGVVMLKKNMVDCEDWDLFSVMSGHYGPSARDSHGNKIPKPGSAEASVELEDRPAKKPKKAVKITSDQRAKKLDEISELVASGDFVTAADELYNVRLKDPKAAPDEATLKDLAVGLLKAKQWDEAIPLMEEFIGTYPDSAASIQLRLANYQLKELSEPRTALKTLKSVKKESLTEEAQAMLERLVKAAKAELA